MFKKYLFLALLIAPFLFFEAKSQGQYKKYSSLLWEITGKGLKKPSYLFGTMHVSSKMVFHLPDSFYLALKNVEAVALELNPDKWQGQMVQLDQVEQNYAKFIQGNSSEYINEKSFQLTEYDDELKAALSSEPTIVNSLLYRSMKTKEDFEEDTFLDLYIYQTGKRLGKRATGVEDYYETEKIILDAYGDMARERNNKTFDREVEPSYDIEQKLQDAYRHGDLNLLDSLDNILVHSTAFRDKFLYKRNEIQANSIDTILKSNSLFVGVGAAHLPGKRGVIELLRSKGYILRPVKMEDRNSIERDPISKLKIPVTFSTNTSDDGAFMVSMPGPLYKMATDISGLDRRQYSDMSNGAYYLVTRIKTHGAFLGISQNRVLNRIDSLLYENIPGKILSKKLITKNAIPGYDIRNRTRRGDLQRYQVFAAPSEVIIFKMSGKENYADGPEADKFFSSIQFRQLSRSPLSYTPAHGGFKVLLPEQPVLANFSSNADGICSWNYEAVDNNTGHSFLIIKKDVINFKFIEEDSFDLSLIEESFKKSPYFEKQITRSFHEFKTYPSLSLKEKMKDGSFVHAVVFLQGAQYYLLAERTRNDAQPNEAFFNSFTPLPYKYRKSSFYLDTFLHYSVTTPIIPEIEQSVRGLIEKITDENAVTTVNNYWPPAKNEIFRNDSTGEMIGLSMQQYPKYYYSHDSIHFWQHQIDDYMSHNEMYLQKRDSFHLGTDITGYDLLVTDTNTSRVIRKRWYLKGDRMYRLSTLTPLTDSSIFVNTFFNSFTPVQTVNSRNIFKSTIDDFLLDYYSTDSLTHAKAASSISNLYYGKNDVNKILKVINSMKYGDKDYFGNKLRFIAELGYIRDPEVSMQITNALKRIYNDAGDTTTFQNKVIEALAKHKTKASFALLKEILVQDPPVFENDYEYNTLFSDLTDSLVLTKTLFPDILQLFSIDDYRDNIKSMLVTMLDSNLISGKDYQPYFTKIWFDARIEMKKLQGKDEKRREEENKNGNEEKTIYTTSTTGNTNTLIEYAALLLPYYDDKLMVRNFFLKLLYSKDPVLEFNTVVLMLKNGLKIQDSILLKIAATDKFRVQLYRQLVQLKLTSIFPARYNNQADMAKSILLQDKDNNDVIDTVLLVDKKLVTFQRKEGVVYFFKYKQKRSDGWKIGISGIQPLTGKEVSSDSSLVKMTGKLLRDDLPLSEQLDEQLSKLIYLKHNSSKHFYISEGYNHYSRDDDNR